MKVFIKHKIVSVESILRAPIPPHTHTHTPAHTSKLTIQNLIYAQLKPTTNTNFERRKIATRNEKTWLVYYFGKINVLRFDWKESREGFCRRGRGRSFRVEGPKKRRCGHQQQKLSLTRNLEAEQSGEYVC